MINGILRDLQKLLRYSNGTAVVAFSAIPLTLFGPGLATVFSNNLALYLKYFKSSVFVI